MKYEQTWLGGIWDGHEAIETFPAEVPGNIQYDYARYHGWADTLMFADNVRQLEKTEGYTWFYETKLAFEAGPGESLWLVAEGVDYAFEIFLNGRKIHSQEGMFTPAVLPLPAGTKPGDTLRFIILPHPQSGASTDNYRAAADQSCKPPFSYGWDWNPRLPVSGLWLPCYVETRTENTITSCEPFYTLNADRTKAHIRFETECAVPVTYTLSDAEGKVLYRGTEAACELENVHLWWCAGQGEPYLYSYTAETPGDRVSGQIGLRTVRLVRNEGTMREPASFPKTRYAACATVELNGRRIFAKGSNWVNPELFPGRVTKQRYDELLTAARDANMNMLRLWGGSGIKKPEFYDLCDRYGILVWQEFMLACNNYRGTEHYLRVLETEARSIVRALRRHACIAFWCGGNELFNGWSGMDEQSHALRLLNKICYEMDFDRAFLMTSPMSGMAHGGYTFVDEKTGRDVLQQFAESHNTAYSEFGVPAMPDESQLRKIIPEDELFPPKSTAAWVAHHAFGAWGEDRWLCLPVAERYFGRAESLKELIGQTQWMQYIGYQSIFEEARRQWPYCSMAVNWCFDEPWITAANNALISYPNVKKPAYEAVKAALRPVLFSARIPRFDWKRGETFAAEIWLLNDSPDTVQGGVDITVTVDGEEKTLLHWESGALLPRTNRQGPTVRCELPKDARGEEIVLTLKAEHAAWSSAYCLHLARTQNKAVRRQLNM